MPLLHKIAVSNAKEMMSWTLSPQKYFDKCNLEEYIYTENTITEKEVN